MTIGSFYTQPIQPTPYKPNFGMALTNESKRAIENDPVVWEAFKETAITYAHHIRNVYKSHRSNSRDGIAAMGEVLGQLFAGLPDRIFTEPELQQLLKKALVDDHRTGDFLLNLETLPIVLQELEKASGTIPTSLTEMLVVLAKQTSAQNK